MQETEDTNMADRPPDADPTTHTRPRWVKVLGIIALVVVLLAIVMIVFGGGQHGPRRHGSGANRAAGLTLPPAPDAAHADL